MMLFAVWGWKIASVYWNMNYEIYNRNFKIESVCIIERSHHHHQYKQGFNFQATKDEGTTISDHMCRYILNFYIVQIDIYNFQG